MNSSLRIKEKQEGTPPRWDNSMHKGVEARNTPNIPAIAGNLV